MLNRNAFLSAEHFGLLILDEVDERVGSDSNGLDLVEEIRFGVVLC